MATNGLDQSELKKHVGYLLARTRFQAFRVFDKHIGEPMALRPVEYSILVLLDSNEDVSHAQLAQALRVAAPNMTGLVRRLEERGLLTRERAERDRRVQHIVLTAQGRQLVKAASTAGSHMDDEWLGKLSPAEQAMLKELLVKLI